jgi:hypothetical protein
MAIDLYGDNNIKLSDVRTTIGESSYNLSTICKSSGINKWAFYRGRRIKANATTKLVEFVDVAPYRLGDFRRYSHSSTAPQVEDDYTHAWGPGGATTTLSFTMTPNELNIKEIAYYDTSAYDYYTFKLYSSSAARASKTGAFASLIVPITYSTITPPTDHTIDIYGITQKPSSAQIISFTGVSTSYSTIYMDSYISTSGGTEKIRFDDSHTDISMHEYEQPLIRTNDTVNTPSFSPPDGSGGWSTAFIEVMSASTFPGTNEDVQQTFGSTSYSFYMHIRGITFNSNEYILGTSAGVFNMSVNGGAAQQVYSGSISHTSNKSVSGTLASGSWSYDDVGLIVNSGNLTYTGSSTSA